MLILLAAWKDVFEMVQEARIDRLMKLVPFAGTVLYQSFSLSRNTNINRKPYSGLTISREIMML